VGARADDGWGAWPIGREMGVSQDGKRFVLRTPVTGYAGKLFQTLGVALPPNIRDAAPHPAEILAESSQP
jgi:hypothetical protein